MSGIHDRRGRAWPTLVIASLLTLTCGIVAGVAARTAAAELTRGPTPAELERASLGELARRWQTRPAGRIFPESVGYAAEQGGRENALRVGISPETRCDRAVDAGLHGALRRAGCRGILRATYIDGLQGIVVTVGVAAFGTERGAAEAEAALPGDGRPAPGLRALAYPGTVTDRFGQDERQGGLARRAGPYLVLATFGQVDGRPARAAGTQRPTVFTFAGDIADRILADLATPARPDCASAEWRC